MALALALALGGAAAPRAQDQPQAPAPSDPDSEIERALEGFEDLVPAAPPAPPDSAAPSPAAARRWRLSGALTLGGSYAWAHDAPLPGQPDYRGWSRVQGQLALQLDLELPRSWKLRAAGRGFRDWFYALEGRDEFPDEVLDVHQSELEFQELWLGGALLPRLDLKVGRQIVSWGRSDNLRVLDLLNPIDTREPGLVNVEDLKLPVALSRLDYYLGPWTLTALAIHESRFDTAPVPGSDFYPPAVPALPEDTPANGGADTEWGAQLRGIFPGWDVSLHWARLFDDQAHARLAPDGHWRAEHARLTLLGISGQVARGDWLLKSELAWLDGLRFSEAEPRDRTRVDVMAGVEYLGIDETSLALEAVLRHLRGFDPELERSAAQERNRVESSLVLTRDFVHDRLVARLVALGFGARFEDGALIRAELEYELRDALHATVGAVLYQDGELDFFDHVAHHDRLFAQLKYSF
jgi:hypothetical protein